MVINYINMSEWGNRGNVTPLHSVDLLASQLPTGGEGEPNGAGDQLCTTKNGISHNILDTIFSLELL